MRRRRIGLLTCCFALIFCAGAARADEVGLVGSIVSLQTYTPSADIFLINHGRMVVKNTNGTLDEYRWGGNACGSRLLTDAHVAALQRALNHKNMTIKPTFQIGQANSQCLVGFNLVEKKNLKFFP
jgi:hypothetical protein